MHRDHPRSRGEYPHRPVQRLHRSGSSPLSRGIRARHGPGGRVLGIIPALAGNTPSRPPPRVAPGDHPRSRGEYRDAHTFWSNAAGSSPLSRGIPAGVTASIRFPRIIPALAGNTAPRPRRSSEPRDHPRSRGEYCVSLASRIIGFGSSPLSRGIRSVSPASAASPGIIPALAGNTPGQ